MMYGVNVNWWAFKKIHKSCTSLYNELDQLTIFKYAETENSY